MRTTKRNGQPIMITTHISNRILLSILWTVSEGVRRSSLVDCFTLSLSASVPLILARFCIWSGVFVSLLDFSPSSSLSNGRITAQNYLLIYLNCHLLGNVYRVVYWFSSSISFWKRSEWESFSALIYSLLHVQLTAIMSLSLLKFLFVFNSSTHHYHWLRLLLLVCACTLIDFLFPKTAEKKKN